MSADDMSAGAGVRADLDARLAGMRAAISVCPAARRGHDLSPIPGVLFPIYYLCGERETPGTRACQHLVEIQTLLSNQICSAVRFEFRRRGNRPW